MSATLNRAAYLMAAKDAHYTIADAPMPSPAAHEVVVRNHAAAINPVDWKIQDFGFLVQTYPFILGVDVAGTVHSVGSDVTKFSPGDRVLAHLDGLGIGNSANGGFQLFSKTNQALVAKLPENLTFTEGTVLPVATSTAAACLFEQDMLGLKMPEVTGEVRKTDEILLIWGGSSGVGGTAIQLATAAGITVVTTASTRNFEYAKSLGASHVFDHSSPTVVSDIVALLRDSKLRFVGVLDAITDENTVVKSGAVASEVNGRKFVATMQPPQKPMPEGVSWKNVFALTVAHNEVGAHIWGEYVPRALADGRLKAKPEAVVAGKGLESIEKGVEMVRKGVSARKVVVEFD